MTFWPRNKDGSKFEGPIRLHEDYKVDTHDYLHREEASRLFEIPAAIIKKYGCRGIVSAGCGTGHINEYLKDYDHKYMGFDTSLSVIERARQIYPMFDFRHASWNEQNAIIPDFEVDCLLLMGVLTYGIDHYGFATKNGSPEDITDRLVQLYNPKHIIVRETRQDQIYVAPGNDLHTVDLSFLSKYGTIESKHDVDIDMWIGNKVIVHVACK